MVRETSIQTYHSLVGLSESRRAVIDALKYLGEATDQEIAQHLGFDDPNRVRPRRKELFDDGLVEEAGKRPCKVTGRTAIVWKLSDKKKPTDGLLAEKTEEQRPLPRTGYCRVCGRPIPIRGASDLCELCAFGEARGWL